MKHQIFLFFVVLLIILPLSYADDSCNEKFFIVWQFKALDENNRSQFSKYQLPTFKEDDHMMLWKLRVTNEAKCKSKTQILDIDITNPQGEQVDRGTFCLNGIEIRPLESDETYGIDYVGPRVDRSKKPYSFEDSDKNPIRPCTFRLNSPGRWRIQHQLKEKDITGSQAGQYSLSVLDDQNIDTSPEFKVVSKETIKSLELAQKSIELAQVAIDDSQRNILVATIVAIFAALLGALVGGVINWRFEKRKENSWDMDSETFSSFSNS